jgi:hypothetical protein
LSFSQRLPPERRTPGPAIVSIELPAVFLNRPDEPIRPVSARQAGLAGGKTALRWTLTAKKPDETVCWLSVIKNIPSDH